MFSPLPYRLKRLQRGVFARIVRAAPRLRFLLPVATPLMTLEYSGGGQSKTLIVFLPGIDDVAEDFEARGFISDLRARGITADAIAVDLHYGYFAEKKVFERLSEVVEAAYAADYEEIWLAGISLGGFGAALYVSRAAHRIAGVLLLSPYLGNDALIEEIADAGGIGKWQPGELVEGQYQRALWAWFKHHFAVTNPKLKMHIGYGENDRFARANGLLAEKIPCSHVYAIAGSHDWRTWKTIWQTFLLNWESRLK
jgi:pimeloyl-ACP methyl ester carboxylesterase